MTITTGIRRALAKACLTCLLILLCLDKAYAHQPDKICQETHCFLSRPNITIRYRTNYGELIAKVEILKADKDGDGILSAEERIEFLRRVSEKRLSKLRISIDGNAGSARCVSAQLKMPDSKHMVIEMFFELSVEDLSDGRHEMSLNDGNFPVAALGSMNFGVHAGADSLTVKAARGKTSLDWSFLCQRGLPGDRAIEDEERIQNMLKQPQDAPESDRLSGMLRQDKPGPLFILGALLIALSMGAAHALSPGHGKAIVTAYLVGEKGRVRDAIVLGVVVTLAHVSTIIILGFVILFLSEHVIPQQLYPWVGVSSGALIVLVGFWMLARRAMAAEKHAQNPEHRDHGHAHVYPTTKNASLPGLLTLGISGGIIPCPLALVVLLTAVSIHRIVLGLGLLFAFSVGLALTLVLIGIVAVKASGFIIKYRQEAAWVRIIPVLSAGIIMLFGTGIILSSLVSANIISILK
ncbi:nickel/cobalt transporter [Candidatus Omnitrophota bacterium]